jgi:hypothetical protein
VPFGRHRFFRYGVAARGLHQTGNRGRSRPALRLGQPAAGTFACASENHAFPTSALQSVAIALRRVVAVRCQLDAKAASERSKRKSKRLPLDIGKESCKMPKCIRQGAEPEKALERIRGGPGAHLGTAARYATGASPTSNGRASRFRPSVGVSPSSDGPKAWRQWRGSGAPKCGAWSQPQVVAEAVEERETCSLWSLESQQPQSFLSLSKPTRIQ